MRLTQWIVIAALSVYALVMTLMGLRQTENILVRIVQAFNAMGSSTLALTVLLIGCSMIIACKVYGIDTTIAGGVIGCAVNMLTSQTFRQSSAATAGD